MNTIPHYLKHLYPFDSKFFKLQEGHMLHYIDEGQGHPIIMVHGNPTWSFFYRNLVLRLKDRYRCIAVDHLGCGLSDKPQDYTYCLDSHIKNLKNLIDSLNLTTFSLVVHDWGGPIGLRVGQLLNEQLNKIVILNTSAFLSKHLPWRIRMCTWPVVGEWLVRGLNAFSIGATRMAVTQGIPFFIRKGYCLPYDSWKNRIAVARFIQDIPMKNNKQSYVCMQTIQENLTLLRNKQTVIVWGMQDFCFNHLFLNEFKLKWPEAKVFECQNAGHYILEDKEGLETVLSAFK